MGEETQEHIFARCPRFERHRAELWKFISPTQFSLLPMCTKTCGLILEDDEVIEAEVELSCETIPPYVPSQCHIEDAAVENRRAG